MNQVIQAAASQTTGGTILGVMTVFFLAFFVAVVVRVYVLGSRAEFDEIAHLPLEDDPAPLNSSAR